MTDAVVELARRRKGQAPPPWVIYEVLRDPLSGHRQWFNLQPGEVAPTILEDERPHRIVWSSIWTDRQDLRIEFTIEDDGGSGSMVTWTLLGTTTLDPADIRLRRYRLNQLINDRMRNILFDA